MRKPRHRTLVPLGMLLVLAAIGIMFQTSRRTPHTQVNGGLPQNTDARKQWLVEVRGTVDRKDVEQAKNHIERRLKHRPGYTRDAGIKAWDELGPDNIGGRIRAVVINPNDPDEIFIGGAGGGIWRSSDAGSSWMLTTPTPLSYPVTSFAMDPTNTDVLYATTGEYIGGGFEFPGIGILKSIDGGDNWTVLEGPPVANFFWLSKIVLNPLDPDILYVTGSTADPNQDFWLGVLYRSNDAGETWSTVYTENIAPLSPQITDIEIHPDDTSTILIGTYRQAMISTNSGGSFTTFMGNAPLISTIPNGTGRRCELSICAADADNIYILRNVTVDADSNGQVDNFVSEVWNSTNGGTNWTLLVNTQGLGADTCILTRQGNYDNTIWVDPTDCDQAILGGINLWKWSDDSLSRISAWFDDIGGTASGGNNSIHADQHIILPDPDYNGAGNSRVYIGNDGGLYKSDSIWGATTNSGWASLVTELSITQMYSVDISLSGDTIYGGAQDNSYFVSRNANSGSLNWTVFTTGDGGHGGIKKSNPEIIYASIQFGRFNMSFDGGDTYCEIITLDSTKYGGIPDCSPDTVLDDNPVFMAPFEMDPSNDAILFTGAERLWRSTDSGASWYAAKGDAVTDRQITSIEVAKGDGGLWFIGYSNGEIWRTSNFGANWQQVDDGSMPDNYVTDIAINPNDHDEVLMTFGRGYDDDVIWYSDDQGATWENRSLPFDMLMYSVVWHPEQPNWAYVGTDQGIFATENDGVDWSVTPLHTSNPNGSGTEGPVFIGIVELVWQGDGSDQFPYYLVAATHGRGVWRTAMPVRLKYYVDKACSPCGLGSFTRPFQSFSEAVEAAGAGSEIVFLSGGTYDNVPLQILLDKRIDVTLHAGSSTVLIE